MTNTYEQAPIAALKPNPRNARTHAKRQIKQIARSIERFGFTNPILVDATMMVLAGHGRLEAAKLLALREVPVIRLAHMSEADKRAYVLADNKLALNAGWDRDLLAKELGALVELGFEIELTGFEIAEIDFVLSEADEADGARASGPEDALPALRTGSAVSRLGDVWLLGRHKLVCADARGPDAYHALMAGESADVIFTDPPYNVAVNGHVRTQSGHREFAMGVGEMDRTAFVRFLKETLGPAAQHCRDGAIAFVCMDWRHMGELIEAGEAVFDELKNLCVWTKSNGGMGSLYRSQHELVFVFKKGQAPHTNTVELGRHGRNRTNVWAYAGVNAFGAGRGDMLAQHPTPKPVAMIEDALKDVSKRNDVVLDPFAGSGASLIAAERCGRRARLIELDPAYCDLIVARYESYAGKPARLQAGNDVFEDVAEQRAEGAA